MKPSQVAASLRRIASSISGPATASRGPKGSDEETRREYRDRVREIRSRISSGPRRPSRSLVAASLRRLLAAMDDDDVFMKLIPDAVAAVLQGMTQRVVTQADGEDVTYLVSFPRVQEAAGPEDGEPFDAVVEFAPDGDNPLRLSPFTLHLHGTWDGFGQIGADVVSGNLPEKLGPRLGAFLKYLTVHVNGLVSRAFDAASDDVNAKLDAEALALRSSSTTSSMETRVLS